METCTAETSYGIGAPCTVAVTFTPKAAGLRSGAVLLRDGSGNTIATAYVHGSGSGPQVGNTTYAAATPVSDTFTVSQWTSIAPGALLFVPMTPCRLADTRNPIGSFGSPSIAGGTSRSFVIPNSDCGVPSTAAAYSVNVTGEAQPNTSTLNSDGRVKANAAIVPAGTNGAISIYASNTTDLVLDINGYFVPATSTSALAFYALTPCRIADTRNPKVHPWAGRRWSVIRMGKVVLFHSVQYVQNTSDCASVFPEPYGDSAKRTRTRLPERLASRTSVAGGF